MDASALLQSQGWLGKGHALNADLREGGLTKPIILPQKQDVYGIGKKKYDAIADQWWLRAFDDVLKTVNVDTDTAQAQDASMDLIATVSPQVQSHSRFANVSGNGSLYSHFVKGQSLGGTLPPVASPKFATDPIKLAEQAPLNSVGDDNPTNEKKPDKHRSKSATKDKKRKRKEKDSDGIKKKKKKRA